MEQFDLLIVGGGAAGMAAALAAERAGARRILLCERGGALGGILPQCIHHGFGLGYFREDLTGPQYAARFLEKMQQSAVTVRLNTTVTELRADRTALLSAAGSVERIGFARCILAGGARERTIQSLTVCGTRPSGIFTAGQAQKLVNLGGYDIGRRIVILGSGDVGQIMARRLTVNGCEVIAMVELAYHLGGLVRNQRDCIEAYRIPVMLRATVTEIHGTGRIEAVTVQHLDTGERERIDCDTLITAVGLIPERELLQPLLAADGTLPAWVQAAGNCDFIHEIVDAVTVQAEALGAAAASLE